MCVCQLTAVLKAALQRPEDIVDTFVFLHSLADLPALVPLMCILHSLADLPWCLIHERVLH